MFPTFCFPQRQLFEIHGSKLKPDPVGNCAQASVGSVSHSMLFFCVCKYSLNLLFSLFVQLRVLRRMTNILAPFYVLMPNVLSYRLYTIL